MQHKVPQFIEIEDKIFGPFTLRQFAYLAGGFGLSIIIWRSLPLSYGLFLLAPTIALTIALTWLKPNGKPFINMFQSFFQYIFGNKEYRWSSPNTKQRQTIQAREKIDADILKNAPAKQKSFTREDIAGLANRLNNK